MASWRVEHEDSRKSLRPLNPTTTPVQQNPTTDKAPVNGVNLYYEVHGSGELAIDPIGSLAA